MVTQNALTGGGGEAPNDGVEHRPAQDDGEIGLEYRIGEGGGHAKAACVHITQNR